MSIGAAIYLPLRTKQITTLYFLAVQVSESPCSPPALQNPQHHLQTHWNCWEPFSVSPWKPPAALWQGPSPTRTSYCFSSHTCTRPALGHGFSSALIARSLPCFLSVLKFPFNTLTGERNTHLTPSGFSPVFHQPVSWHQVSTLHSLNAALPAAPHHPRTSGHPRIFTTKVLPILMLVCLDLVPSGSSLSRVVKLSITCLSQGLATLQYYKILHQRNKGSSPPIPM